MGETLRVPVHRPSSGRESVGSVLYAVRSNRRVSTTGSDVVIGTTESPKGTMVLQVLDLVSASNESFYGDCPVQTTYTNLDLNATGHTTCTVVPQGTYLMIHTYIVMCCMHLRNDDVINVFHVRRTAQQSNLFIFFYFQN